MIIFIGFLACCFMILLYDGKSNDNQRKCATIAFCACVVALTVLSLARF